MKIKQLNLRNFGGFRTFELVFDPDLTQLAGPNGAGKTTIGETAIWAGLKGIAERSRDGQLIGKRYQFIGPHGNSSDIKITLIDDERDGAEIIVRNHITKTGNAITFTAPDDYPMDEAWLRDLLNVSFMSAKHFCELPYRDQALALGIDTSEHDDAIEDVKQEISMLNRDLRRIGEIDVVEETERVSTENILSEIGAANDFNLRQQLLEQQHERRRQDLIEGTQKLAEIRAEYTRLSERLTKEKATLDNMPEPEPPIDTEPLKQQLRNAENTNRQAAEYDRFLELSKVVEETESNKAKKQDELRGRQDERLEYIQSFEFPFRELSVDDHGGLLVDGRRLNTYSHGERERYVALMWATIAPELKVRFIDDIQSLDEKNRKTLLDELCKKGIQVITAEVTTASDRPNVIMLKECQIDQDPTLASLERDA